MPWHYHNNVKDTFYVIDGHIRVFLRHPAEEVRLGPGDIYSVESKRPHSVKNDGDHSAFLVLQQGEYDYVPL